jgi:hypothetical protein
MRLPALTQGRLYQFHVLSDEFCLQHGTQIITNP